jgi:eukaryotic-like serine/threonine-protein kinase
MGEVYRATDSTLGRHVAIKILSEACAHDTERLARFGREAKTLASLNHPNIAQIYGLEEFANSYALVMELVEGPTIADRIARGPLPVTEALPIARQLAEALEAAHEQGIIHRDFKPANIKVRPDGVVKVLDFGLAKALEPPGPPAVSQIATIASPAMTLEGVIVGTVAYMSPEQARAKSVDQRADIWAFGCVLYEMLTGRAAFAGATLTDTLAAIVEREPNWAALPSPTPDALHRLLRRCLNKDPKLRLRDIGDARAEIDEARNGAEPTVAAGRTVKTSRRPWMVAAVVSTAAVISATASMWRSAVDPPAGAAPGFSRIVPLTRGPAREFGPTIDPDGKWVAYLSDLDGQPDVWIRDVAGGEPANLTAAAGLEISATTGITGLDVSPDGTRIAVMAKRRGIDTAFATWEVPAPFPGVPQKRLDDGYLGMRWSNDGRKITFILAGAAAGDALFVADADGTNRQEIVPARDGLHIHWPTWSRDDFIYFIRTLTTVANLDRAEIYRVHSRGGAVEPVVSTMRRAMHPVLMPNGEGLVYAANPVGVDLGLWWRPVRGGEPQRLTLGTGDFAEPRISENGRTLVATRFELRQSLTRVALTPSEYGRKTAVTDGYGGDLDPSISPASDRVVFSSSRTGDRHLWTARLDGSDLRPLTSGTALDDRPVFAPDGKRIAFNSDRDGRRGIWVVDAEGGTPGRVADASATGGLSWSPDGQRLVYAAGDGGWPALWSVSVADGEIQRIPTPGAVSEPAWNPTRDLIAYMEPATSGPGYTKLAFVNSAGQPQYTALPAAPAISAGFSNGMPAWSPDGRRLAVVSQNSNAAASIWIAEPESVGMPFRKLIELPVGPRIRGVTWTRDGSALIIGQHDTTSDIVLLTQH